MKYLAEKWKSVFIAFGVRWGVFSDLTVAAQVSVQCLCLGPPLGSCTQPGLPQVRGSPCVGCWEGGVRVDPGLHAAVLYFAKPENHSRVLRGPESPEAAAHSGEIHILAFD